MEISTLSYVWNPSNDSAHHFGFAQAPGLLDRTAAGSAVPITSVQARY